MRKCRRSISAPARCLELRLDRLSTKLAVKGLDAAYGRAHILFDVALDVGAGEAVALVGRNGAGKSTTLRSILGLVANCGRRDRL